MKGLIRLALLGAIVALGVWAYRLWQWHLPVLEGGGKPRYVGSRACKGCHPVRYESQWHTLHRVIFRPVTSPAQILGDFNRSDPLVTFKRSEITHVVGSRWEQVYLKKIDGDFYPLPAKWMVLTQKWEPYKVHSWMKTPASTHCNGCHTTGYDPATRRFKEYGVRCEACHGPGGRHAAHMRMIKERDCLICHDRKRPESFKQDIAVDVGNAVCGQCHTRGKTTVTGPGGVKTTFNFPLRYLFAKEGNATFSPDRSGDNYWKNRLAKNRHQEFGDFAFSAHARALEDLRKKPNPHGKEAANDGCLRCHSQDYRSAPEGSKPSLQSARYGLTCVTCHEPHGLDRLAPSMKEGANRCGECHLATALKNEIEPSPHYPCPSDKVTCADCHMPRIVKTGGTFSLRSHAFKIVPPRASVEDPTMPNSCQNGGCHADKSVAWAVAAYAKFYENNATLRKSLQRVTP